MWIRVFTYVHVVRLVLCGSHSVLRWSLSSVFNISLCFMRWLQQMCVGLHFTSALPIIMSRFAYLTLSFFIPTLCLLAFFINNYNCLELFFIVFAEENSFVTLDHGGILQTEIVTILAETQFTIYINAYPAPKVSWMKDNQALSENYYISTKTSHIEQNRWAQSFFFLE